MRGDGGEGWGCCWAGCVLRVVFVRNGESSSGLYLGGEKVSGGCLVGCGVCLNLDAVVWVRRAEEEFRIAVALICVRATVGSCGKCFINQSIAAGEVPLFLSACSKHGPPICLAIITGAVLFLLALTRAQKTGAARAAGHGIGALLKARSNARHVACSWPGLARCARPANRANPLFEPSTLCCANVSYTARPSPTSYHQVNKT